MGHAKQAIDRRRHKVRKTGPAPEKWVVLGTDRYGEPFEDYGESHCALRTRDDAEDCAARVNRRGGNVVVKRLVWNSPAAAYRDPDAPFRAGPGE